MSTYIILRACPVYDGFSIKICFKDEYLNPYVQKVINPSKALLICKIGIMKAISTPVKFSEDQIMNVKLSWKSKGQLCFSEKV